MTPHAFLATSGLLGLFVLAAGAYGVLYGVARLQDSRRLLRAATVAYAALCALVAVIVIATPLGFGWKLLIGVSALVYYAIPPVTWRHLHRTHRDHGAQA
jgi:multisubunit Na+/H+ antiporter MnhG subunit